MSLQGWRLFGVTAIVTIYIVGVLFLSINNVPGSHLKRFRMERSGEIHGFRNQRISGRKMTIHWCKELHFINIALPTLETEKKKKNISADYHRSNISEVSEKILKSLRRPTALASFPGSGNTWFRYLIQQSTGILTGSIYRDHGLLKNGFPAENVYNNSVLLVKTHEWGQNAWEPFSKAILLIRDPDKAILAEFNRQSGGHVGFASPDLYKRTKGKYWQHFVANKLRGWEIFNLAWATNFTGNLKIVFYDDLVNNLEYGLRDVLQFLDFPIDEVLMKCAILRKEGIFKRKKRILAFDPYTAEMRAQITIKQRKVYTVLGRYS